MAGRLAAVHLVPATDNRQPGSRKNMLKLRSIIRDYSVLDGHQRISRIRISKGADTRHAEIPV